MRDYISGLTNGKLIPESIAGKPNFIYLLSLMWLALAGIFAIWASYSLTIVLQIPSWEGTGTGHISRTLVAILHFGYLTSTVVWFVFSALFIVFAYGVIKGKPWVWSGGLIITTIFLMVLGLMLASFMVNAIMFLEFFSVSGLVTVVLSFIIDIGLIYYLTRPVTKLYFQSYNLK